MTDKCNGFPGQNQGCRATGCPRGLVCAIYPDGPCVSSSCFCNPETGSILCTADCGGGTCIPEGETDFPTAIELPPNEPLIRPSP